MYVGMFAYVCFYVMVNLSVIPDVGIFESECMSKSMCVLICACEC